MGACDTRRKLFDYPFIAEIIQRPTSDTLQFLVDENAGITSINAVRRYIDTIPCQSEHFAHTQRAGERKVQGQQ